MVTRGGHAVAQGPVQVDEVPVSARKRYRVLPDPSTRIWPRGLEATATTAPEEDGDAAGGEGLKEVVLPEEQAPVKRARTASAGTMNLFMTLRSPSPREVGSSFSSPRWGLV